VATSRAARRDDSREQLAEIEGWYRRALAEPADVPPHRFEPVRLGPTWQVEDGRWVLPEHTLGWQVLAWCGLWLQESRDVPWRFTLEQARFLLWWYAVDWGGQFLFRDGVLQRLKGWGKDPLGACISMAEILGPVRFRDWDKGQPVGGEVEAAWVQTAAVSLDQTKNTMRLLPGMVSPAMRARFGVQVGKEQVYALGDTRFMQAVTSSPAALQGARSTFVLMNETHEWISSNNGHEMALVISNNATKSSDGAARTLRITNAYNPGTDSVAEHDREAWEKAQAGEVVDVGLLYDSLEAHPDAPLTAEAAPEVVNTIRGDSVWLNTDRIVKSILDIRIPPSQSRRFWFNQIVAAEDAWADPQEWDSIADTGQVVMPGEPIVAFFDGSKSDDTTALVGCRMSDGHVFYIDSWSKPPRNRSGPKETPWQVPRDDVDESVRAMFEVYNVVAFWADPSDTRDDEGERFWEPYVDDWHQKYGPQLKLWAQKAGDRPHAVAWDMRSSLHQKDFTEAAERFIAEMKAHRFTHDGHLLLKQHVRNARRYPNAHGVSLAKEHRESRRKIDLAVCAVGARMLRRAVQNKDTGTRVRSGRVW
jgi:hypothetical protein